MGIKRFFERFASMDIETNKKVNLIGVLGIILISIGFLYSNEKPIIMGITMMATAMLFRKYKLKKVK